MTTISDMNTPEESTKTSDINEYKQHSTGRLQVKLSHDQIQRRQHRDYARILRECNKPSQWYQASPRTNSIYFYDPSYQRLLQQHPVLSSNTPSFTRPARTSTQSPSHCKKNNVNLRYPLNNNQQNPIVSSRLESVSKLPPITIHKKNK